MTRCQFKASCTNVQLELYRDCTVCQKHATHHLCSIQYVTSVFTVESEMEVPVGHRFCSVACVESFANGNINMQKLQVVQVMPVERKGNGDNGNIVQSVPIEGAGGNIQVTETFEHDDDDAYVENNNSFGFPDSLKMKRKRSDLWCWDYVRDLTVAKPRIKKGKTELYSQICVLCSHKRPTTEKDPFAWKLALLHAKEGTSNAKLHVKRKHEAEYQAAFSKEQEQSAKKRNLSTPSTGKSVNTSNPILDSFSRGKSNNAHREEAK
jgi:hypothetical protein